MISFIAAHTSKSLISLSCVCHQRLHVTLLYSLSVLCLLLCSSHCRIFCSNSFFSNKKTTENNGNINDATSVIAEPMPDVADGRDYPGMRPFAEPGMSISNVGPCGQENYGNQVRDLSAIARVRAADMIL